jgi:hypothetical protein
MRQFIIKLLLFVVGENQYVETKDVMLTSIFSQAKHGYDNRWY